MPTSIPKSTLKSYFETGDKPDYTQFCELIDACYGTDQTLQYMGSGVFRMHGSDGTSHDAQITDMTPSLYYDPGTRNLTLTLNGATNPVGPLNGLWSPGVGNSVYYNEPYCKVGIGTSTPSERIHLKGGTLKVENGYLQFGNGQKVNSVGTSNQLGTSNLVLPTQKAVKEYVDSTVLRSIVHVEVESNSYHMGLIPRIRTLKMNPMAYHGYNVGGAFDFGTNEFTAPSIGRYLIHIRVNVKELVASNSIYRACSFLVKRADYWKAQRVFHTRNFHGQTVFTGIAEIKITNPSSQKILIQIDPQELGLEVVGGALIIKRLPD